MLQYNHVQQPVLTEQKERLQLLCGRDNMSRPTTIRNFYNVFIF